MSRYEEERDWHFNSVEKVAITVALTATTVQYYCRTKKYLFVLYSSVAAFPD